MVREWACRFFATGTTSKVSNKHRICPPIMVTAIEARCSEPAPMPMATGISPAIAIMESVVIRIGRSLYAIIA
jgi:hypothetical protein